MATTTLDELLIELRADNRQLLAAFNQSRSATNNFAQQAQRSGGVVNSAFNGMSSAVMRFAGPAVLGYAIKQVIDFGIAAMNTADQIGDTAEQLGLSTDAYQGLGYAATQSGASVQGFESAMRRMLVTSGEALDGNDEARDSFKRLGISIEEVATLSPEQLFIRVGDAVSQLASASDKAAASAKIFGKEGVKLVGMFKDGAEGVQRLREEAEKLGVIIDDDLIKKSAEMNDQWEAAKTVISANATAMMLELAPAIVAVTKALAEGAGVVNHYFDRWREIENISDSGLAAELARVNEQLKIQKEVLDRVGTNNRRSERLQELIKENEERAKAIRLELQLEEHKRDAANGTRRGFKKGYGRGGPTIKPSDSEQKEKDKKAKEDADDGTPQWILDIWENEERLKEIDERTRDREQSIREGIEDTQKGSLKDIEDFADGVGYSLDRLFDENETGTAAMLKNWSDMAEQMDNVWGGAIDGASDALTDFIVTGEADFESFAASIIKNLIKIQIQKALAGMLGSSTGAAGAGGGIWGSLGGLIMGGGIGGGLAGGGTVQSGVAYPVGERGPEVFVPATAGKIVPSYAMGGGGQTSIKVEVINKGTPQKAAGAQASQTPKGLVATIMLEDLQTGGPISKGMQGAFGLKRGT